MDDALRPSLGALCVGVTERVEGISPVRMRCVPSIRPLLCTGKASPAMNTTIAISNPKAGQRRSLSSRQGATAWWRFGGVNLFGERE